MLHLSRPAIFSDEDDDRFMSPRVTRAARLFVLGSNVSSDSLAAGENYWSIPMWWRFLAESSAEARSRPFRLTCGETAKPASYPHA
jgi:hypothetical protein